MRYPWRPSLILPLILAGRAAGQLPDSARAIPDLQVTVTRTPAAHDRVGASVTVLDSDQVHRGRLATNLDEALAYVPGMIVQNRGNYSLDERVAIRGFGARANFGLRGVKVILDGVPQTLPDGQSQLNNLDLTLVNRIEVLRGGASSLYGNAAGGVLSFTTSATPATPWQVTAAFEGGSFGSSKGEVTAGARLGTVGGTIAVSRFATDGYREQSATEQRRLNGALDWAASASTTFTLRVAAADDPHARNPGALTAAELAVNPDSASAGNIRRGADKSVTQTQLAFGMTHDAGPWHLDATVYGLARGLVNPLATPPPAPASPAEGTWSGINRILGGARMSATARIRGGSVTGGFDTQWLRDDRINRRSVGGVATDTLLVDQREQVGEGALFADVTWPLTTRWTVRGGIRHDLNHFAVADHLLTDGDASGSRTLAANSGNAGVALQLASRANVWTNVSTVFQTPTTTELANRPDGGGGFNPDLNPERSITAEVGMRAHNDRASVELAVYHTTTSDAIVPYNDVGGRTYYRNAGSTRTEGAEAGARIDLGTHMAVLGSWTLTDAIFTDYGVVNGVTIDTLTGRTLAGVPRQVAHVGIQGRIGAHLTLDIDQGWSSSLYADDDNTIRVDGWGAGVTGLRAGWSAPAGRWVMHPYFAVLNLFDRTYVGSVTIDGAAGRVFEPAPRRTLYAGVSLVAH